MFRINDDANSDFRLDNIDPTGTVATLRTRLRNGGHITFTNFELYRNNFGKDVKEHMKPNAFINDFFQNTPDLTQVNVLIRS